MSQERQFLENLLNQRFNFLLVFYSLVVAGAASTTSAPQFISILSIGALICTLLALPIWRAQRKLDLILDVLFDDPHHPATIINRLANEGRGPLPLVGRSMRRVVGYVIPAVCSLTFIAAAILACFGWLAPHK